MKVNVESLSKCDLCEREFPDELIRVMTIFAEGEATQTHCCPLCALDFRNKLHGLPEGTPFKGELAHELWLKAEDYLREG